MRSVSRDVCFAKFSPCQSMLLASCILALFSQTVSAQQVAIATDNESLVSYEYLDGLVVSTVLRGNDAGGADGKKHNGVLTFRVAKTAPTVEDGKPILKRSWHDFTLFLSGDCKVTTFRGPQTGPQYDDKGNVIINRPIVAKQELPTFVPAKYDEIAKDDKVRVHFVVIDRNAFNLDPNAKPRPDVMVDWVLKYPPTREVVAEPILASPTDYRELSKFRNFTGRITAGSASVLFQVNNKWFEVPYSNSYRNGKAAQIVNLAPETYATVIFAPFDGRPQVTSIKIGR